MNESQLLALLTIKATCNLKTIKHFKTTFNQVKYGVTTFDYLMLNGYIVVSEQHGKYCRLTQLGIDVIGAVATMTELLPNKLQSNG